MTTRTKQDHGTRSQAGEQGGKSGGGEDTGMPNPIELQRALKGVDYPASRDQLLDKAREAGADASITEALEGIPDREYEDPAQVSEAVAHKR
ncbi:DUF2795 domain-containing protein [Cupriavidus taiwanensis]|uniref:DUF2795 domain-containing protein n=1 Tax=Cupriavidus taiwanensis (strain DSM 17343 / BCRC 17206 / CCUG 44338 / CIP 107171 / LMG 19424 / R1) TaxID=977880 RepID=B3RC27_CUPTR|nr:DUF2795 domain-containing protein [Cupriavidus taiwanensis]CAQ72452.1 conserved hypothetical protein [Cupriavidus taiwanensis LMG 19424]